MNLLILATLGAGLLIAARTSDASQSPTRKKTTMRYFKPAEFGRWWPDMSPELLEKLDEFRHQWGGPVVISPAEGGIGRNLGHNSRSQHNIDLWGEVRAVDVFPQVPDGAGGYRYMDSRADRERAYRVARAAGFTGIGLYTDTRPGNMVHLDVRPKTSVATWSRVDGNYLDLGAVLA